MCRGVTTFFMRITGRKTFHSPQRSFRYGSDKYKYTTYYGLWDTDEFYDIQADPNEQNNLIRDPSLKKEMKAMEKRLYEMMADLGGMDIPMNAPRGGFNNKRLREREGDEAANFPSDFVVDEPVEQKRELENYSHKNWLA
jgi:N-acetylglucosamine-6-sulfatase